MESFLRSHPFLRTLILLTLLLGIVLEGLLLYRYVEPTGQGAAPEPSPTPERIVICQTTTRVNLRAGPALTFDTITELPQGTVVTATGRNGEVPWLAVRLQDEREGWLSSLDSNREPLVTCEGDMMELPEAGPPQASNGAEEAPTATAEPAPTVTETPAPTITAAPDQRLRVGNGPDLHAAARTFEIAVDGRLGEWGATSAAPISNPVYRPENWSGPEDLSGQVRAAWDGRALYLALAVTDDVIVQENREDLLYRGDAVELFLDLDLAGDFDDPARSEDDAQLIFSPGDFGERAPSAWVYYTPTDPAALLAQITVRARPVEGGYTLEASIPWEGLGLSAAPGTILGYAVALSDNDSPGTSDQQTQLSTTNETPFNRPTVWGNLILD